MTKLRVITGKMKSSCSHGHAARDAVIPQIEERLSALSAELQQRRAAPAQPRG